MRFIAVAACLVAGLAFTSLAATTPAQAGPGLGGGYEKSPPKKASRRKRSSEVAATHAVL